MNLRNLLFDCYCWWRKSCTTKDNDYPIIYRVLTIPTGAGFLSINSIFFALNVNFFPPNDISLCNFFEMNFCLENNWGNHSEDGHATDELHLFETRSAPRNGFFFAATCCLKALLLQTILQSHDWNQFIICFHQWGTIYFFKLGNQFVIKLCGKSEDKISGCLHPPLGVLLELAMTKLLMWQCK